MKMQCSGRCIRGYNQIQETTLISTINDFLKGIDTIYDNPEILQQFYDYIQMKYLIPCEIGMMFIEKITMDNVFKDYRQKVDSINCLTNNKMKLYQWIKPKHLEISCLTFTDVITSFTKIKKSSIPSVKIYHLMDGIKKLYDKIGRNLGLDVFFPYLVYCLIKTDLDDIYANMHYINTFRRKFFLPCSLDCDHGFQIGISCDCLTS